VSLKIKCKVVLADSPKLRLISVSDPDCVRRAAATLKAGGLVCYPTDTVYGLGALACLDEAVRRLFIAKGRSPAKPLPLLLADTTQAEELAAPLDTVALRLIGCFWPGALTLVLQKASNFQSLALAGQETLAVRVPDHALLREVIRQCGGPLVGTSANRSGDKSARTVAEAAEQLGTDVDLFLDGGRSAGGRESTIVDCTQTPARIVRQGPITRPQVEAAIGEGVAE